MNRKSSYWSDLKTGVQTLLEGLLLSISHLGKSNKRWALGNVAKEDYFSGGEGLVTLQYPKEKLPVPEIGRYKLHNEIEDCIVCDKCAKICPVNCIEIEPIRAVEEIGKTSDGTPKRIYAARFDIDMAKCCYCGLCTTVCPTECLTMTDDYDFSTFNIKEHTFAFAEMTPLEILEKRKAFDEAQLKKQTQKPDTEKGAAVAPWPVFKPKIPARPASEAENAESKESQAGTAGHQKPKPVFKPKMPGAEVKPAEGNPEESAGKAGDVASEKPETDSAAGEKNEDKKPVFRPKPIIKPRKKE